MPRKKEKDTKRESKQQVKETPDARGRKRSRSPSPDADRRKKKVKNEAKKEGTKLTQSIKKAMNKERKDRKEGKQDTLEPVKQNPVDEPMPAVHPRRPLPAWLELTAPWMIHRAPSAPVHLKRTTPLMSKYELAKIRGLRATALSQGAEPLINPGLETDPLKIAAMELMHKRSNQKIRRYFPTGQYEDWNLSDLILPEGSDEFQNLLMPRLTVS